MSLKMTTEQKSGAYKSLVLLEWWPKGMLRSLMEGGANCLEELLTHELLLVLCCCWE